MNPIHKPGHRVAVVASPLAGEHDSYSVGEAGTVVASERCTPPVAVQLDGSVGVRHFWPDELMTIGQSCPTVQDAEDDWDDGSFYDIVRAVAPYAPRRCEAGGALPRRPRAGSSQAGLQALKFRVAR